MNNKDYYSKFNKDELVDLLCDLKRDLVRGPEDLLPIINGLIQDWSIENVVVLALNTKNQVINSFILTIGGHRNCTVDFSVLFRKLLLTENLNSFILIHNHPSGDVEPSQNDLNLANELRKAGDILRVPMTDFAIVSRHSLYYSFNEKRLL